MPTTRSTYGKVLYFEHDRNVARSLVIRVSYLVILMLVVILFFSFDRSGLRDYSNPGKPVDLVGVVYFTVITITGLGYGDVSPVTQSARIFVTIFAMISWTIVYLLIIPAAAELMILRLTEGYMIHKLAKLMKGHNIICGLGQVGREVIGDLLSRGMKPDQIVAIDISEESASWAAERGVTAVRSDVENEEILRMVNISRAKRIYLCTDKDHTNLLICLSTRALSESIEIIAVARAKENVKLFRKAGATRVICLPEILGLEMVRDVNPETEKNRNTSLDGLSEGELCLDI